ncbi:hypothetical protein OIU78_023003 [Salix suchowensis]|nr:hypothetical protein OIU78_023003 [Salix suchowensis]
MKGGEVREKQRYTESKVYTRKAFKGLKKNSLINTAITTTTTDNNSNTNITTTTTDNNSNANIITTTTAATGENDVNTTTTTATATTETATAPTTTAATGENDINTTTTTATATTETATAPTSTSTAAIATKTTSTEATETATGNETNDKENYEKDLVEVREPEPVAVEDRNTGQQVQQPVSHSIVVSDDSTRLNREEVQEVVPSTREQVVERELPVGNGVLLKGLDNRVKVNLLSRSKQEKRELRKKLESELELVRSLVKKIEVKELQLSVGRLSHSRVVLANDGVDRRLRRVNSEVGSVGVHRESTTPIFTPTPRQFRPLNQLSISVLENSQGVGEFVEKEKRTPKANQFYRNSEFLLAKDKFPPAESNKKSKLNGRKQGAGELGFGFGTGTKSDYDHEMRFAASYEVGIPTPTSRKNPFVPPPLDMRRILDRSVSMPYPIIDTRPKPITTTPSGRTPVPAPVVVEAPKETKADERNVSTLSPNHVEKQRDNGSRSSSSSSSSSDSGSSSSDSDSDSSSASGSDVGN